MLPQKVKLKLEKQNKWNLAKYFLLKTVVFKNFFGGTFCHKCKFALLCSAKNSLFFTLEFLTEK
jgi:hypothetical protein